ncbi:MAG: hypothetical protein JW840_09310 [Candidatus Thermoplasmatota archaeon]|nr:hypothetical protein [Candidatus Thermoplasmatota archaeon]
MKRLLWLGLLFLSASWLCFIPQFTKPDLFLGSFFIIVGIVCVIGGVGRTVPTPFELAYTYLLLPLIPALAFIPFPYNLGLIVLAIGLLLHVLFSKSKTMQAIPLGVLLSGGILCVQILVFPFYQSFVSHGHRVDLLSPVISSLANILGLHTSTNNGVLFVQTIQQTSPVTITWEKLGFYLALNMTLGAILLFILFYKKRVLIQYSLIFLFTTLIYSLLRFIGVLSFYLVTSDLSVFWDPVSTTLSFLPLVLLLMKLLPFSHMKERMIQFPALTLTRKHLFSFLLMFLLVFSLLSACFYQEPGLIKPGRVLIDEYHSQWEDTLRPLDTEWYGLLSTYNYYSWAQWLKYHYTVSTNTNSILTSELLSTSDILILKCPTESYTMEEIDAVKRFVETGGGLYLIGDHTNVFGMNTFLNQISEQFGIRFKTDATYELGTGGLSSYHTDSFWSHPVMRHVPKFQFMTSCTLEPTSLFASVRMENIIIGNQVISEPGTYSTENFFRESIASPDSEYGYLLQAAAMKYGSGRVVAFTDSTVFSSFCMFTDGYPSFTLGVMEYLNRTNSISVVTLALVCISLLSLFALYVLVRTTKRIIIFWMFLLAGLLAFSIVTPLCLYLNDSSSPFPPPTLAEYTHVCFDEEHSSITISLQPAVGLGNDETNYGTFFVWTQRVGCIPSLQKTLRESIATGDIIIMINPIQPFNETDIQLLTTYLETGGRVLLLDSITNTASTANECLGNFGLWLTTNTNDQALFFNRSNNRNETSIGNITTPYLSVVGGKPLLTNEKNETMVCMTEFINTTKGTTGKLLVAVDSYTFSDVLMGGVFTEPNEQQRLLYNTEFFVLNEMLNK